jgi:hypothetical protein
MLEASLGSTSRHHADDALVLQSQPIRLVGCSDNKVLPSGWSNLMGIPHDSDSSLRLEPDSPATDHAPMGLLLSRDLIFTNKITGTAAELGYRILVADNSNQADSLIKTYQPRVLFVDLTAGDFVTAVALSAYQQLAGAHAWFIAFGPHVDGGKLADAKAAGCQTVMPRSRFAAELPELIRWCFRESAQGAIDKGG